MILLMEYFRAINLTFNYFHCSVPTKNETTVMANNGAINSMEVKTKRNSN